MTRLRTMLYGALALFASMALTTPAMSDSSNFAGPYLAVQGSVIGVEMDGEFHDVTQNHQGKVGMVSPMMGLQAGYNFPVGDAGFLTIGATLSDGDASFDAKELANSKSVTIKVSQFTEYGELTKKEYSALANAISKFNKVATANGGFTKLHIRTTDIGVVVYRKSTLTDKRLV